MNEPRTYSEEQIARRIRELNRHGMWPGTIRVGDDRYRLTCDPDVSGIRGTGAPVDMGGAPNAGLGANLICPPSDQAKQGGKSDLPPESIERDS